MLEKETAAICQDFTTFCGYITENKVKVAMKTGHIGKKDCFALNKLLQVREEYEKPNYLQNQYPVINFFYYVAVRYKILEIRDGMVETPEVIEAVNDAPEQYPYYEGGYGNVAGGDF